MSYAGDPWDQQPAETARSYEAFRAFRDLGPARRLADVPGRPGAIRDWSTNHHWLDRAKRWDGEMYRLEDQRRLDQIRQMDETHQAIARTVIATALRALQADQTLTPHQAARLLDIGTRLQRAALTGEHPTRVDVDPGPEVEDELSPLERIARELAGTA